MNKEEIINFIREILSGEGSEEELHKKIFELEKILIDPDLVNYMYYEELSAEEIYEKASKYEPIILPDRLPKNE